MIGGCAYTVDISDNDYKNMLDTWKKNSLANAKKLLNEHYGFKDPKEVEKSWDQNIFNLSCSQGRIDGCIKKVIFNNPATIVYWKDGTKTVVMEDLGRNNVPIECYKQEIRCKLAECLENFIRYDIEDDKTTGHKILKAYLVVGR